MANYSHPKCYAKSLNNCSTKISGEHIISNNILEIFERQNGVKLAGLPWMDHQVFNLLSRKSLVSNVLCTFHNEFLSPFDMAAGNLFRCLNDFDTDFNSNNPKSDHRIIKGEYIEKWMLKIVCGIVASNQIDFIWTRKNFILKDE